MQSIELSAKSVFICRAHSRRKSYSLRSYTLAANGIFPGRADSSMQNSIGIAAAVGAYVLWGILPIFWKSLHAVPAQEILLHRMVWSLFFTLGLILLMGRLRSLAAIIRNRRSLLLFSMAALLLSGNWLLYIWAVNAGYVIEASLGYFINPLVSVLLGVIFLTERLRPGQIGALVIALLGVMYLTFYYGQFPWIALSLACSFGLYGFLHKKVSAPAIEGLCLETMVLFVPAAVVLLVWEVDGRGAFGHGDLLQTSLLLGTGLITSWPLLLFGFAAQRISLTHLGLLQYIAPTINLLLGIFLYHEPFPPERMAGFGLIWSALFIYMAEGAMLRRRRHQGLGQVPTGG